MSTIVLDYPNSIPLQRSANFRWIVILIAGLALVASVILVAASASAKVVLHPAWSLFQFLSLRQQMLISCLRRQ